MKIDDNYTVFEYNPKYKMRITTNEELRYNFQMNEFEINQNPFGEEQTKPIFNVEVSLDFNKISFSIIYKKKIKSIVLTNRNKVDTILYKFFNDVMKNKLIIGKDDLDNIIIIINNDLIDRIDIYKENNKCELLDSLCIVQKDNELFIEKYYPVFSIHKIVDIKIFNNSIIIYREDGKTDNYHIDSQDRIINLIKKLIENIENFI